VNQEAKAKNVLPYSSVVGQAELKLALEVSYIEPRISGVLISGERGSGKSTTVRAFSNMLTGELPVTLPINATEDRVIGGWDIDELLQTKQGERWKRGLLEDANGGMLYVDEVNLLDDHIVNIILDVTASGLLTIARDSKLEANKPISFTLVGTMNPEEGMLRPQLTDRFGLMVDVRSLTEAADRLSVLEVVLGPGDSKTRADRFADDAKLKDVLDGARKGVRDIDNSKILQVCVDLADAFKADGSRGELTLALAACALAARESKKEASLDHVRRVAPLALQHRRKVGEQRDWSRWSDDDTKKVSDVLYGEKS
jgi:magnesium chelatase subunit I